MDEISDQLTQNSVDRINVSANPAGRLDKCIREAIILSMQQDTEVVLTHNGRDYLVSPDTLRDGVEKISEK